MEEAPDAFSKALKAAQKVREFQRHFFPRSAFLWGWKRDFTGDRYAYCHPTPLALFCRNARDKTLPDNFDIANFQEIFQNFLDLGRRGRVIE